MSLYVTFFPLAQDGRFRFDEEFFPIRSDGEGTEGHGNRTHGFHLAQIDWKSENYEEMKQKGLLVKAEKGVDIAMLYNGNSTFYDATNPRSRSYVWENVRKIIMITELRYSGWMKRSRNTADMILIITGTTRGTNAQIGNIYPQPTPEPSMKDRRRQDRKMW